MLPWIARRRLPPCLSEALRATGITGIAAAVNLIMLAQPDRGERLLVGPD